jgi:hypothetical protein
VRIKDRKLEYFRLYLEFTRDHVKRRSGGDLPARTRRHHMARHAARLGESLAIVRVGSERGRHEHRQQQAKSKQLQSILLHVGGPLHLMTPPSDRG